MCCTFSLSLCQKVVKIINRVHFFFSFAQQRCNFPSSFPVPGCCLCNMLHHNGRCWSVKTLSCEWRRSLIASHRLPLFSSAHILPVTGGGPPGRRCAPGIGWPRARALYTTECESLLTCGFSTLKGKHLACTNFEFCEDWPKKKQTKKGHVCYIGFPSQVLINFLDGTTAENNKLLIMDWHGTRDSPHKAMRFKRV